MTCERAAEKAVKLFESNTNRRLKDALFMVKRIYHLSNRKLAKVKSLAEKLLTYQMLEPERFVDVC